MESASGTDTVRRRRGSSTHSKNSSNLSDSGSLPPKAPPKPKWVTKLIPEESTETDNVSFYAYKAYVKSLSIPIFVACLLAYFAYAASQIGTNLWLAIWSDDSLTLNNITNKRDIYLGIYGAFGAGQVVFIFIHCLFLAFGSYYSSNKMHDILLSNVIRSPLSFFDSTSVGRLLNRFSKDIDIVDVNVPMNIRMWLSAFSTVFIAVVIVSIASPYVLIGIGILGVWYYFVQRLYISSSRQLKRLDSMKRTPIYAEFQSMFLGACSIRAYGRQVDVLEKSLNLLDSNQSVWFTNIVAYRWLGVMLEIIGNIIIFLSALFAVVSRESIGAGLAAAAVTYALQVTGSLNFMVRVTCDLENYAVAVERIVEYAKLKLEAPWKTIIELPSWPQEGQIQFTNYSLRYSPDRDDVIKSLNATIKPREKVAIVGRSGSGKSSLTLGLFRIIEASGGSIEIDGVDISRFGLHDLRSRLTLIPQEPVMFTGTLRMNLDPCEEYTDGQIWSALDQAQLKTFVSSLPDGLMHACSEGGENLSVSQRQLLCLARALLRKPKVLILDKPTATVDLETDDLIQNTIRREFKDCTILTIAHRLNTIMDYDSVMVLDDGKMVEYDTPTNLLNQKDSLFSQLSNQEKMI